MTTQSSVDKNTVFVSGLPVKTNTKPLATLSSDISDPSQGGADASEDEQAIFNKDPMTSKQKVDDSVLDIMEFNDTAEFKFDDTAEITINKGTVSELFPDHSPSIIDNNDVSLDTVTYPDTIESCIKVISKLRYSERDLHLNNTDNVIF